MTSSPAAPPHSRRPARPRIGSVPVIDGAEPYAGGAGPLGALVLHGFTGSPFSVRPWADRLQADGFAVSVPRLPGHGTSWREANQTRWTDWYAEVESAFTELSARCERTYVCGLSMGGGLALLLAARQGKRVSGLSLVNPSVASADPRMLALPVLRHVTPSLGAIGGDIAMPDVLEGAYDRTPLHAAWSLTHLWRQIQRELPAVDQPMRIYRSQVDHVVGPRSLQRILAAVRSTDLEVVPLERSHHVATLDYDADLIFSGTSEFFTRLATAAK